MESSEKQRIEVPWLKKADWDQVRQYLYSDDVAQRKMAVEQISAWKDAEVENMPVAMNCTADLVRCQIQDRSGRYRNRELVMLYGVAIVRFVNLVINKEKRALENLGASGGNLLNIPEWVVGLGYDFSHTHTLPSLDVFREGCEVLLQWIKQHFWSKPIGGGPDELDSSSETENVSDVS